MSGYHSNELSSIIRVMSLERLLSKEYIRRRVFQCVVSILLDYIHVHIYRINEAVYGWIIVRVIR
jgi:hypothetical protein